MDSFPSTTKGRHAQLVVGWDRAVTDDDLRSAQERFAAQIPGLVMPVAYGVMPLAYGVTRKASSGLTSGHVNAFGAVRQLPAVVLASVCGYVATTGIHRLDHERFTEAIERLAPAGAATHRTCGRGATC